ncbi:MAG: ABC transporter substrate-binding protein, partial [Dehalococcoidia bacterium]
DDDEDGAPTATEVAAESPTPSEVVAPCEGGPGVTGDGEELKIGVLVPSTGALSTFGPDYINAAELAAKCLNDAGGVNGGAVVIRAGDTGTTPEQGVTEAERLVNIEGVAAIMGAASSAVSLAVAESVTIPNEIVQISPASTSPALTEVEDSDFLFRTPISDAAQGVVLAQLIAEDLGLTSVCDLFVNNAYGQGLSAQYRETFEALGGTVTASVPHDDAEAVSYSAELNQCVDGDPEALVAISYPVGQATIYLKEALEGGLISEFVFVDGTKENDIFIELGWENFDGMLGTAPGALATAFGDAFDEAFVGEYGELYQTPFVRESFDAVIVMALAAQAAGTNTDSAAIRDALRDVSNTPGPAYGPGGEDITAALAAITNGEDIDYQGASGSVDFDEHGDITFGAIEVWRVDAATETLITDRRVSVDLATGEIAPIE